MAQFQIRRGLDIPIAGAASGEVIDLDAPSSVAFDPRELRGFIPRLEAREGDEVKRGQKVLFHKFNPDVCLVSPVAGTIKEVRRGRRRVITDYVIEASGGDEVIRHRTWTLDELEGIDREAARAQTLGGGGWPLIRTRPLDHVADPEDVPQAILIGAHETGPLQPGADILLSADDKPALQAAIHVLAALTDGKVHLARGPGDHPALSGLEGVEEHTFSGPHPAGDPGVQVNHVDPPAKGRKVWTIRAWDAVKIGRLFLDGVLDQTRIYAAVGAALSSPRYVRTLVGAPIADVVGESPEGPVRYVRGSILTGARTEAGRWMGLYPRSVHVLPDEVERELLGWALPKFGKWSFHRAYLKGFAKASQRYDLRPGLFGGHRAIVPTGALRRVVATPDIEPTFLFKSIIAGDLEGSIQLGMLDITEEEAALCSYVDPSKNDFDVILREGLELYAKEA